MARAELELIGWQCPECGDRMHPKFRPFHTKICPVIARLLAADVERAIEHFEGR